MRPPRLVVLAACAASLALPATAAAVPPLNDNYMQSTIVTDDQSGRLPTDWKDAQAPNTTEATEQADLFNPGPDGTPGSGGGAESLTCNGSPFAKTVWYDLHPPTWGGVELDLSGFDMAVAVYEYSASTNRITRLVLCQNDEASTAEQVLFDVERNRNYTVQIGGIGGAAGQLAFHSLYFRDSDNDGTLNAAPDECPGIRGTRSDGCPPTLSALPRYSTSGGSPITLTRLSVEGVVKGSKVEASCSRCGRKVSKTARKRGTVNLNGFVGRRVPAGDHIVIRITHRATGKGRYKFGAIGKYYSYSVEADGIGKRKTRCLNPGSRKPVSCKS